MKTWRYLLFASLPLLIQSVSAQGKIIFANRNLPTADSSATYNAPIERRIDSPFDPPVQYRAALLHVKSDGTLSLVGTTTFGSGAEEQYFASEPTLIVDGVLPGQIAVLLVRVYNPEDGTPEHLMDIALVYPGYVHPYQSEFFRSLPLGGEIDGVTYPIPKTTGLKAFDTGNFGPFGFDKNNQFFFHYLKPSANWIQPGVLDEIPAGSTDLPMWKIHAPVDYIYPPGSLYRFLDLSSGSGPGHVSRIAPVIPGYVSSVSFFLSGNRDPAFPGESSFKTVRVTVDGASYVLSHDIAAQMSQSTAHTVYFIPEGASAEVHFESLHAGQAGPMISSVNVISAPGLLPPGPILSVSSKSEISWESWVGFKYQLESAPKLQPSAVWTPVGQKITASEQVTKVTLPPALSQQFYRVSLSTQ